MDRPETVTLANNDRSQIVISRSLAVAVPPVSDCRRRPTETGASRWTRVTSTAGHWLGVGSGLAFCLVAAGLHAADDNRVIFPSGNATAPVPASATGGSVASTMTLVLALVLAAVGAWMIWRNRRSPGAGRDARNLMLEETRSLGNRQYLVVASYEGKRFLLGVCPGRIDMLTPLDGRRGGEESGQ